MAPSMMEDLLFDDILYGEQARAEHRAFCAVLQSAGVETLDPQTLLRETLEDAENGAAHRSDLLDRLVTSAAAPAAREHLESLYFSRFLPNRPRPLSSFDTHARWQPVTQSARSRRSYGRIEDCEQSTNMAAVSLFWDTNMAAVTSCESLFRVRDTYLLTTRAAQTHYMNADVTLACERCCVTNGYLQRLVWDRSVYAKRKQWDTKIVLTRRKRFKTA